MSLKIHHPILAFAISFCAVTVASAQHGNVNLLGQFGGTCNAVAFHQGYAVVGVGPWLQVMDLGAKRKPTVIGKVQLPDTVTSISIEGNLAYVGTRIYHVEAPAELVVVDLSDAHHPVILSSYPLSGPLNGIAFSGDTAYITFASTEIEVLDVSDPADIALIYHFDPPFVSAQSLRTVRIANGAVLVLDSDGVLQILDFTDPDDPDIVTSFDLAIYATSFVVDGGVLWVATGNGVRSVDVSDIAHPEMLGNFTTDVGAIDVEVSGDLLYALDYFGYAYAIDISDPESPDGLGKSTANYVALDLAVDGTTVLVASDYRGMRVLDFSDSEHPIQSFNPATPLFATAVQSQKEMAYVGTPEAGLWTLDTTKPAAIRVAKKSEKPKGVEYQQLDKKILYSIWQGMLSIQDCSDVDAPGEPTKYDFDYAERFYIAGSRAYVSTTDDFAKCIISTLDLGAAGGPREVGSFEVPQWADGVASIGDIVCVPQRYTTMNIYNLRKPESPKLLSTTTAYGPVMDMATTGHWCYFSGSGILQIVDLADPENPQSHIPSKYMPWADSVAIYGNLLFVTGETTGLRILDISNPFDIEVVGQYNHYVNDVTMDSGRIYTAGGARGAEVLEFTGTMPAPPAPTRVQASDGKSPQQVLVTWDVMAGARGYTVWRSEQPDSTSATMIGSSKKDSFKDKTADPGVPQHYWVRSKYFEGQSEFGEPDDGYRSL